MSTGNVMGKLITPTTTSAPGIWNLREHQLAVQAGTWTGIFAFDSASSRNVLTMKAIGAGATTTTFRDSSANNFTVTRNGDVTQGTFSPYFPTGYWSGYFDGSGDSLTIPDNTALQMGTGDFTYEFWWFPTSFAGYQTLFSKGGNQAGSIIMQTDTGTGKTLVASGGSYIISTTSAAATLNTWNHVALVRSGTTLTAYLNGASVGSGTLSSNLNNTSVMAIGIDNLQGLYAIQGYISSFRAVKGSAVYTSAFTPPAAPLAAITNTSLLCLQDGRLKDNSTNNFTVAKVGDAAVTRFSPFTPPRIMTGGTYGGSGYFNGSTDYLQIASNLTAFSLPGDFTIEFWICPIGSQTYRAGIVMHRDTAGWTDGAHWGIRMETDAGKVGFGYGSDGSYYDMGTYDIGAWSHHAVTRSGTTLKTFKNGVLVSTVTNSSAFSGDVPIVIGRNYVSGLYYSGYISNARIVKGAAVYTAAFTPPTTPVTAISGTGLLVNFDNAGIYDSIGRSDLRTLGTAKVGTSTTKWGAASIALDGTANCCVKAVPGPDQPYAFGTGDFTIEMWFNLTSMGTYPALFDWRPANTSTASPCIMVSYGGANKLTYYMGTATAITGTTNIVTGTWYHAAVCRASGVTRLFLNGVQEGGNYSDTNSYTGPNPTFGALGYDPSLTTYCLNGCLEDIRVTRAARYTAAFTPPIAPFA